MNEDTRSKADAILAFLAENKVRDPVIIDMSEKSNFTDCFIIGTVSSIGHLRGVVRNIWDELSDLGIEVINRHKSPSEDGWELIDTGSIVIHLMSKELREFYNLERLWRETERTREEG